MFTDLYSKKDLEQACKVILKEVNQGDANRVDAKHVSSQTGHDNIYANSKKGKAVT